ncbi:glycoside hydrolase family 25 protein [Laedolimicola ammoniilytica]|uniref:GH25 family lysozyme n=1 Tax=Laedolimicola ammoniilytica TaxID=2981771 RepID=A0ABT2RVM2_9FIRM|nr:GH25 family lysozyme [Laedolimicola ammoniilytica]MCU6696358.1 GH25 family lysozyme [Laedolimicola ammoniilytica]SCH60605.1 Lysozyme M1 precursor [uncultured Clostridium sp.]
MKAKRVGALLLSAVLTVSLLGGCSSRTQVSEDMIPTVTDLQQDSEEETAEASVIGLTMNKSYVAELTRLDGDNTQMAKVDAKEISVVLKATSLDKDLKIQIVNQKTGKVITGTAFEVTVTDSAKKTESYTDKDKDGIIYVKSMKPGKCTVSMKASGGYSVPADITADVKANIEYKAVDVSAEIKSESQINVAKEDSNTTGNDSAGTAQTLKDTVEYVESAKTEPKQKVDQWGQLVYAKQKLDKYGTPMYAKIISEPAADHVDSNGDKKCDRCGADMTTNTTPSPSTSPSETPSPSPSTSPSETPSTSPSPSETPSPSPSTSPSPSETPSPSPSTSPSPSETPSPSPSPSEPSASEALSTTTPAASVVVRGLMLLKAAPTEKIVYDTSSAPVYDTSSDPVYEDSASGVKYTGWQTIDGATYYFDKNGNKVTGTQVIQGIQYTFSSEGVRSGTIGIDVSKYQSGINWQKVKNAGINFAIIRCGYRGYGSGVLVQDPKFASHISGAKAAGLRVGIYFFSQAITEAEAVEEASMAVKLANQYGINMPIAIDSEYAAGGRGRADGLSKAERTRITVAFCNTVANSGYKPMVYASKSWFASHLDVSQFGSYRIWVAHYAEKCGYGGRYDIWQNTSKGSVDGVPGNVDMNISSI